MTIAAADALDLRDAVREANLPTLVCALAQLTGDPKWMEDPYRPSRQLGPGDNDDGGFAPELAASIRDEALAIVAAVQTGMRSPAPAPAPERVAEMLSISLGGMPLPDGYGPFLAEELGLTTREVSVRDPLPAEEFNVLVIGAGFSGLHAAIRLGQAGIACTVVEKNDGVGGTWLENGYPGCGVDTPSHLYSLSFAQRHDWPRYFSGRDDLRAYLEQITDAFGIRRRIRFGTEVVSASWDDAGQAWSVDVRDVADGSLSTLRANAVITCVGFLNRPSFPRIEGLDAFAGPLMHTAEWQADVELRGRRVAVIGTGASAMQLVPTIAGLAERVIVFQRSAQWAVPHPNYKRAVSPATQIVMRDVPHYLAWYRLRQVWLFGDRLHRRLRIDPAWPHPDRSINEWNEGLRRFLTDYIRSELGDRAEELMPRCVPDYPPYGKRILIDNGWWRTLTRDDVSLVTEPIREVVADGVRLASGAVVEADVVVLATGFHAVRVLYPMEIRGRSGRPLAETWGEDDPRAYLGITVPDLPNLFCLLGPNTFPGHGGSGVLTSEMEMQYVIELLAEMVNGGIRSVACRHEVHDAYNERLDAQLAETIWAHPGMTTYYRNSRGRIVAPMPWSNVEYWHMTRRPSLDDYHVNRAEVMT